MSSTEGAYGQVYGDYYGGRFTGEQTWTVAGYPLQVMSIEQTPRELAITAKVDLNGVDIVRSKFSDAGDVETIDQAGGTWRVVSRSGSPETVNVEVPSYDRPPYPPVGEATPYVLEDYSDSPLETGRYYEIDLTLLRDRPREVTDQSALPKQVPGWDDQTDDWLFQVLGYGSDTGAVIPRRRVITPEVSADTYEEEEWTFILTRLQAKMIMEVLTYAPGVTEREVPDGANYVTDTTANRRRTVTISPGKYIRDSDLGGELVVTDWTLTGERIDKWILEMTTVNVREGPAYAR